MNLYYAYSIKRWYEFYHVKVILSHLVSPSACTQRAHLSPEYKNRKMFWSISNQYSDSVTGLHVQTDGCQNSAFIKNLDQDSKGLLLLEYVPPPFDSMTLTVKTCFFTSAIYIIYTLRTEILRELEAPLLRK